MISVFCLTIPSLGMGNIFTVGSTAALAWELPHDPLTGFRRPAEVLHRKDEVNKKVDSGGGWKMTTNTKKGQTMGYQSGNQNKYNAFKTILNPQSTISNYLANGFNGNTDFSWANNRRLDFSNQHTLERCIDFFCPWPYLRTTLGSILWPGSEIEIQAVS